MQKSTIYFLLATLLFVSCSKPVTIYTLDAPDISPHKQTRYAHSTIKIAYPKSIKDMMSRDIIIKYDTNKQSFYQHSIWAENINRLTMAYITDVLERSRLFKTTMNYSSYAKSDFLLEIFIHQMHHRIYHEGSYALLSIKLNLLRSNNSNLIKTRHFNYRIPTATQDVKGFMESNQKAWNQFQSDMIEWIAQ
ncbi:MAG: hypothetical protein KU38_05665 [Sulfurovum sp. FS08-3]|nr:MAG: hypothetical protein KU38_05665 [Sulfurovum sp. FS08-3]